MIVFSYILMGISLLAIMLAGFLGYIQSNENHILLSLFSSIIYILMDVMNQILKKLKLLLIQMLP